MSTLSLFERSALFTAPPTRLRPYQSKAIQTLRERYRDGKRRMLLVAPTGAGKMVIVASVIQTSSVPALFICHRMELIEQCVDQLARLGITNVGVIRADDERTNPSASTQVASIQTLARREKPTAGLVLVDEAHRSASDSYVINVFEHYNKNVILGFTATPTRYDGRPLGNLYEHMEVVTTYAELIKQGFIVEPECYGAPKSPDLSRVRIIGGDYEEGALGEAMREQSLVGNILDHWLKLADKYQKPDGPGLVEGPRRRTFIFAASIQHSLDICDRFARAGIKIAHLDGTTPEAERRHIIKAIDEGELEAISNCNVLCLDEQTEILTSTGWVGIDVMTDDHLVANWDNRLVTFEKPIEVIRRERGLEERMVSVHGERIDARVTEGHWMIYLTSQKPGASFQRCHARDLVGRQVRLPISGIAESIAQSVEEPSTHTKSRSRRITSLSYKLRLTLGMSEDISRAEAARRIDRIIEHKLSLRRKSPHELTLDECRFIGFWTGDGWCAHLQSGGVEYKISQSEAYPKIIAWVDSLLNRLNFDFKRRPVPPSSDGKTDNSSVHWSFPRGTGNGIQKRRGLFPIEMYLDKSGSNLLWELDGSQFDAFIEGLWLADGDHGDGTPKPPKRAMWIHNTNKKLIDTIQAIGTVRGYGCSVSIGFNQKLSPKYKQNYILRLRKRDLFFMGWDRFNIEPGWKPERVWCVRTRTKSIITRRNGKVMVMGNCEGVDVPSAKCVVHARPTQSLVLWRQTTGRSLRPWHPNCRPGCMEHPSVTPLLLDHAGNIDRHGFPHEDLHWELHEKARRFEKKTPVRICKSCYAYLPASRRVCPFCGAELPEMTANEKKLAETQDQLVRRAETPADMQRAFYDDLVKLARKKGHKPGFAAAKFKEHYGNWPPWAWSEDTKASFACDSEWQVNYEAKLTRVEKYRKQEPPEPPPEWLDVPDNDASEDYTESEEDDDIGF
jgi:superfamily II DNA or RNA helicase